MHIVVIVCMFIFSDHLVVIVFLFFTIQIEYVYNTCKKIILSQSKAFSIELMDTRFVKAAMDAMLAN